jgi:hypothetical protein
MVRIPMYELRVRHTLTFYTNVLGRHVSLHRITSSGDSYKVRISRFQLHCLQYVQR